MEKELPFSAEYVVRDLCGAQCKREMPNSKGELTVRCPLTNKWIEINVAKGGVWKCFRGCPDCPGNCGGGVLDFYNLFFGLKDRGEAFKAIEQSLGIKDNGTKEQYRKEHTVKPKIQKETADIEVRNKTYSEMLKILSLSDAHRKHLLGRGFTDEYIKKIGFRSVPQTGIESLCRILLNRGCQLEGVPGFYKTERGEMALACYGSGFFIPYRDDEGRIQALQIRRDLDINDKCSPEEKKEMKQQRYRWLTSSGKDGGSSASNYAYFTPPPSRITGKRKVAYATEGGLKAEAARCWPYLPQRDSM